MHRPVASTAALLLASFAATARAEDVPVATADELIAAIADAAPGDVILLADGIYPLAGASCTASGTAEAPIVVRSATPLGARIELDAVEGFKVSGAHWRFEGLDVQGVCGNAPDCEHAFHVVGGAEGFVLRGSRVRDFNAQLKVNAQPDEGGVYQVPHRGLIEGNELRDTAPRDTDAPVTKLNIDTGDGWVVRANVIADFHKNGGNEVSYGAFMKSGGHGGLFERNLVLCSDQVQTGGVRIGLSFGGGGTGAQYCAPSFDPEVPCDPEHEGGVMRNNIIASCSDVGIYLNLATNTKLLHNTLIDTAGIDFRFASSTGEADGNVLSGAIAARDGGTFTAGANVENVALETFLAAYQAPLSGDLRVIGDVSSWEGAGTPRADVVDDYCLRDRPDGPTTLGALEHTLGDCVTVPPPQGGGSGSSSGSGGGVPASGAGGSTSEGGSSGDGAGPPGSGGGAASPAAGPGATGGSSASAVAGAGGGDGAADAEDDGCGCRLAGAPEASGSGAAAAMMPLLLGLVAWLRRPGRERAAARAACPARRRP